MKKILLVILFITVLLSVSVTASAAGDKLFPAMDYPVYSNYPYYTIFWVGQDEYLYLTDKPLSHSDGYIITTDHINIRTYLLNYGSSSGWEDNSWTLTDIYSLDAGAKFGSLSTVSAINYHIYDTDSGVLIKNGDLNFLQPSLAEKIQMVTGEILETETVPAIGGIILVLTISSIGLLALVIVLHLFGKKSLMFTSR